MPYFRNYHVKLENYEPFVLDLVTRYNVFLILQHQ